MKDINFSNIAHLKAEYKDQTDFLTPGSEWARKDDQTRVWFLMLTNQTIPAKHQKDHPAQVIYADAEGNIFNRGLNNFFLTFQFVSVDGTLEAKLDNLFGFSEAAVEAADDSVLEVNDVADLEVASVPALHNSVMSEFSFGAQDNQVPLVIYKPTSSEVAPYISPEILSRATIGYSLELAKYDSSSEKQSSVQEMLHRITFELSEDLTLLDIQRAFDSGAQGYSLVNPFVISTNEELDWIMCYGVYPKLSRDGQYATLIISSEENFDVSVDKDDAQVAATNAIASVMENPVIAVSEDATSETEVVAEVSVENVGVEAGQLAEPVVNVVAPQVVVG